MPVEAWSSNLAWSSLAPVAAIAAGVDQGPHWWRWRYVDDPQGDQLVVLRAVHRVSGRSAAAVVGWQDGADGRRAYIEEIWGDLSDGRVLAGLMAAAMAWAETQGAEALVAAAGGADWQGRWSAMGFERRQRTAPAWTLHTRSAGVDESELSRRAMFHHGLMF